MFESIPAGITTPEGRDGVEPDTTLLPALVAPLLVGGGSANPFPVGTPVDDDGGGAEERSEDSCSPPVVS